ncbi:hypothetical protein EAN90_05300 [Vibrio parahaemolyticus]|nr:hypothetical protein [Vibrio parahaemolyticus]TBT59394.1 hypothetical protein D5E76_06425 [Vibrio parahaemolyticus]
MLILTNIIHYRCEKVVNNDFLTFVSVFNV